MSAPFPTRPAFIHHGCWSPITRSHPALEFLEEYSASHFDARAWDTAHFSEWHHKEWELTVCKFLFSSSDCLDWEEGGREFTRVKMAFGRKFIYMHCYWRFLYVVLLRCCRGVVCSFMILALALSRRYLNQFIFAEGRFVEH